MQQESLDATIAAGGSKATYTGAGAATVGWFLSSEFGVLCGIVIGLAGLLVNIYFKRREDKRLQEEHEFRMKELRQ